MDNNHISGHNNNSLSHSVAEIGDRLNSLNVNNDRGLMMNNNEPSQPMPSSVSRLNVTNRSLSSNYVDNISSMHHNLPSRSSNLAASHQTFSKLNPSAQEFVPRSNRTTTTIPHNNNNNTILSTSIPTHGPYRTTMNQIHSNAPLINHNNHHRYSNGAHVPPPTQTTTTTTNIHSDETYIEDYISLSYLKEFINQISNKPSMYDQGINELTSVLNKYLDEDDCVLELIVNQIVDQSIIDCNFLYNGVRLCCHFMEKLRETQSGQSFKQILFKRNQRECSRRVTDLTSANTFSHLHGLALFTAELYSRSKESDLADHLPGLLTNLLSSDIKRDENVKCVCDVLKLCGQQLETYFSAKGKPDFTNLLEKLKDSMKCDIKPHSKELIKKVLNLVENNWVQAPPQLAPNLVNPYLNNPGLADGHYIDPNMPNLYEQSYELYDFGNCGDENNAEVCRDFENFLKSTHQN